MKASLLLFFVASFISRSVGFIDGENKDVFRDFKVSCVDSGLCISCSKNEMFQDYCKDTGRKMRTICSDRKGGKEIDDYRACTSTAEDDQLRVIVFQVMMAVFGSLAYFIVQGRKHMTMYDTRRQSTNPRRQG